MYVNLDPRKRVALDIIECAFRKRWIKLSREGACDDVGGAEYWRVFKAWCQDLSEIDCGAFIRCNANQPPPEVPS